MLLTAATIFCLLPWLNILTHSHHDNLSTLHLHTVDPEGNGSMENCGCPEGYICDKEDNKCYFVPNNVTEQSYPDLLKDYKAFIEQKKNILEQLKHQKKKIFPNQNEIEPMEVNNNGEIEMVQPQELDEKEAKTQASTNNPIEQHQSKKKPDGTATLGNKSNSKGLSSNKINNDSAIQPTENGNPPKHLDLDEQHLISKRNGKNSSRPITSKKIKTDHFGMSFTQITISLNRTKKESRRAKNIQSKEKDGAHPKVLGNNTATFNNNVSRICIEIGRNFSNTRCVNVPSFDESLCKGNQSPICGPTMTCHKTKSEGNLRCGPAMDKALPCNDPQCQQDTSICLHYDNTTSECLEHMEGINEENCGPKLCPPASTCVFIPTDGIHPASALCILKSTYIISRGVNKAILETNTLLKFLFRNWILNSFML